MNLTEQQKQQLREVVNLPAPKFSRSVTMIIRAGMVLLVVLWIAGGLYLNMQVKQDEQRIEQARIEQNRRQEFLRRDAQYKQDLQRRTQGPQTRNVFEGR